MLIAGALCRRFGSPRVTVISCALLSATLVLPALARSVITLGLTLLVFGAAYGCLNVAMNSIAVDLVAALRRPVMPGFHASWSFGGLAGAGIGGLLAPHVSAAKHLMLVALAGLLVAAVTGHTLLARNPLLESAAAAATPPPGRPAWRQALQTSRTVGLFGLIALCAAYDEGAIGDWGALHLRQDLGAGAGLAATGYAAFALAEATGRLSGTALLEGLLALACSSPRWSPMCGWPWPGSPRPASGWPTCSRPPSRARACSPDRAESPSPPRSAIAGSSSARLRSDCWPVSSGCARAWPRCPSWL